MCITSVTTDSFYCVSGTGKKRNLRTTTWRRKNQASPKVLACSLYVSYGIVAFVDVLYIATEKLLGVASIV